MSQQFTPGPWTADLSPDSRSRGYIRVGVVLPSGIAPVAVATSTGRSHSETCANARLIAAAPDLLAALKLCVEHLCKSERTEPYPIRLARIAIAKAEGKEKP